MLVDLPLELWFHILSFLPKGYIRRMIGVNRMLFELALDEIFRDVRFISDSHKMISTFKHLRRPGIARRVIHFYIRPGFLPGMETPAREISGPPRLYKDIRGTLSLLRTLCSCASGPLQTNRALIFAQAAIRRCSNVRELTIVLHDFSVSRSFAIFLKASWTHLAGSLRKLTIEVTLTKLPLVLEQSESCRLAALEELEIYLVYSRIPCYNGQALIRDILLPFTTSRKGTLRSLSISSSIPLDWSPYLKALGYFPLLEKLVFIVTISYVTLSEPFALTRVLDNHQKTLKHFEVRKNYGYFYDNPRDSAYKVWATDELSTLVLPALQTLEIGLWPDLPWLSPLSLSIIPHAPFLVSLSIIDFVLYDIQVEAILNSLPLGRDGEKCLQDFRLSVLYLHPQLVDLLASKLPHLKSLDLTFDHLAASTDISYADLHAYKSFKTAMRTRMYTDWKLEYLKLSISSSDCGHGHYQLGCMNIVARCIRREVLFGLDNDCFCEHPRTLGSPKQRQWSLQKRS